MKNKSKPSREGLFLLYEFIGLIFVVPRQWYADERLTFKRLFPDVIFNMLKVWYTQSRRGASTVHIDKLYPDLDIFTRDFEEIMNEYELVCKRKESKGKYALSRHDFRYSLSKCRFSKLGLTIYASILDDGDSISETGLRLTT